VKRIVLPQIFQLDTWFHMPGSNIGICGLDTQALRISQQIFLAGWILYGKLFIDTKNIFTEFVDDCLVPVFV